MPILDIKNLRKSYGAVDVLKDISVSIEKGDFLVLLGGSGCGKSTMLNCIAGLEEVTGGEIVIDGRVVNQVAPKDRDIAMVFQSYALYPNMTVAENILFGMKVRRSPKAEQVKMLAEVAKILQIEPLLDRKPAELSGGQRQRVAIGRALVRNPKLFLFDEPLSNLDARLRGDMRAEIRKLHQSVNASIVYVTHDQIEAMTLATKVVLLDAGVIQQVGTPDEIYQTPANLFVAEFIGSPPMNVIPMVDHKGANVSIMMADGKVRGFDVGSDLPASELGYLGIRPEDIVIGTGSMTVEILSIERTGADQFVKLALAADKPLVARAPAGQALREGEMVQITLPKDKMSLFCKDGQNLALKG